MMSEQRGIRELYFLLLLRVLGSLEERERNGGTILVISKII